MSIKTFRLNTNSVNRAGVIESCAEYMAELPLDHPYDVIIQDADESRRSAQLKLSWLWWGQIAKCEGTTPDYVHGRLKLDVLHPLMLTWESTQKRALFVDEVLSHVPERSVKIGVAYDMIRSKDLTVKQFAEWLSIVQAMYAEQGLILECRNDVYDQAMGVKTEERKVA